MTSEEDTGRNKHPETKIMENEKALSTESNESRKKRIFATIEKEVGFTYQDLIDFHQERLNVWVGE